MARVWHSQLAKLSRVQLHSLTNSRYTDGAVIDQRMSAAVSGGNPTASRPRRSQSVISGRCAIRLNDSPVRMQSGSLVVLGVIILEAIVSLIPRWPYQFNGQGHRTRCGRISSTTGQRLHLHWC